MIVIKLPLSQPYLLFNHILYYYFKQKNIILPLYILIFVYYRFENKKLPKNRQKSYTKNYKKIGNIEIF